MNEEFEVKQDRVMGMVGIISAVLLFLFLVGITVLPMIMLTESDNTYVDIILYSMYIICFAIFSIIVLYMSICIITDYLFQRDCYTKTKLIRKKKGKIIFELNYNEIISVKTGFNSIWLFCKKPIIKQNGKKGPRTLIGHYSKADIRSIIGIITDSNYEFKF